MDEREIDRAIQDLAVKLPRFPDGRIDYSRSDLAFVISCFVKFEDKILLLKRSEKVRTYQGKWHTVAGYIDEPKPLRQKALQELNEELGVSESDIARLAFGEPFEFYDPTILKTWRVHPVLAELARNVDIKLNWEHTEFLWVQPADIGKFDTVPKFDESLKRAVSL
ncbi:MAG TPA: NUDIX domain-containing protein [Candidatus Acidoferrales bacterium]|nr:NUDIX domain-containing protein [Candidatus Acidoferrales bacterium]